MYEDTEDEAGLRGNERIPDRWVIIQRIMYGKQQKKHDKKTTYQKKLSMKISDSKK